MLFSANGIEGDDVMAEDDDTTVQSGASYDAKVANELLKRQGLFYMWHLEAIGFLNGESSIDQPEVMLEVIEGMQSTFPGRIPQRRSRVAIIDNGVTAKHSALSGRVNLAMDFTVSHNGLVYEEGRAPTFNGLFDADAPQGYDAELEQIMRDAAANKISPELKKAFRKIVDGGADSIQPVRQHAEIDPSLRFAAHGTSCAGLVGANAIGGVSTEAQDPAADHAASDELSFEYIGLNPFCEIVPITTTYDHRYWPIILSLIYALAIKADVILLPRAIEDLAYDTQNPDDYVMARDDPRWTRIDTDAGRRNDFQVLKDVLALASKHVPLIVPAGNSGRRGFEFPASLVVEKKDGSVDAPDMIVVGASTALGLRASYSNRPLNDADEEKYLIYAPSDDREVISQEYFRADYFKWRGRHVYFDQETRANTYSPYGVLTLDLPGRYGYNVERGDSYDFESSESHEHYLEAVEFRHHSEFTLFGGTSAASAIVAGFISLAQQFRFILNNDPYTGEELKPILWNEYRDVAPRLHKPLPPTLADGDDGEEIVEPPVDEWMDSDDLDGDGIPYNQRVRHLLSLRQLIVDFNTWLESDGPVL